MTSSLTACLKKAGDAIAPADRAAILARSRDLRGEGLSAHAAAKQAVSERLELVKTELNQAVRASLPKKAESAEKIDDIGEKIGGARKDTAVSTGRAGRVRQDDDRPTWAKRFEISQIVRAGGQIGDVRNEGRWAIYDKRGTDRFGQARPVGGWDKTFATKEEAEAFLPLAAVSMKHRPVPTSGGKYEIWREITDRKRVKVVDRSFDSRDEAMAYIAEHAAEILETNTTFGEADLPSPPDRARSGPARRDGDVKGEDFRDTFGFRGVEFGNWNNQDERQALMNDAFDGLMDLADVLGVPPKALGLNGDLALAFGARGQGLNSARAHYERERAVINLTKENGAGSLAHEWFHGLDHYFGRQDGKASSVWEEQEDGTRTLKAKDRDDDYVSHGFGYKSAVRPEVRAAYDALIKTIFKKATVYQEDTGKADAFTARAKEDLARELDSLRKELSAQKDPAYYKRNNKPASAEQLAEFDGIAKRMLDGEAQAVETDWKGVETAQKKIAYRWTNDSLEQIGAIFKAVRGRSGFDSTNRNGTLDRLQQYMKHYSQRLKMLADAQQGAEKTKMVPTDFAMNAKELDQGRGGDYWTTPHEMAARAFQAYVEDKIAEGGGVSRFLNYAPENAGILTPWGVKRPYPAGAERKAINAALDGFVQSLKTEETDTGVRMYARSTGTGTNTQRRASVQRIVDDLTAKWKDKPQITVVESVEDLPGDHPADTRGVYSRGHVWIVAGNPEHATRGGIAKTLAHEAVAHYGLRAMLGKTPWETLMDRIQLGIKSNNKALLAMQAEVRKAYVDENGDFELSPREEADEIAAKAVENAIDADGNFRPGFGFLKAVFARVAQFLRERGFDITFTNTELQGMLVLSMRNMERGQKTAGGGRMVLGGSPAARARETGPTIAEVLLALGKRKNVYQLPRSDKKDLLAIAADKSIKVEEVDRNSSDNTTWMVSNTAPAPSKDVRSWLVRSVSGKPTVITEDRGRVYINVSGLQEGGGGSAIYDLAANYALNNGMKFIGDPNGVSPAAMRRRLENMLSSAIKYGTTDHLQPHPDQIAGRADIGVPALRWQDGDTAGNIEAMVEASVAATADSNPIATSNVFFDPATQSFRDGEGLRLGDEEVRGMLGFDERGRRAGAAGNTTLRRNALFRALLSGVGARRDQMAAVRAEQDNGEPGTRGAFDGDFYARGVADQTETPAFKRWFGDSKVVDAEGRPLVVYHGTTADMSFFDKLALGANTSAPSAEKAFFFAASPKVASGYAMLAPDRPTLRRTVLENAAKSDALPPDLKQFLLDEVERQKTDNATIVSDMAESQWISNAGGGIAGANVLPLYLKIEDPLVVDYGGKDYRNRKFAAVIAEAQANGNDGVIFRNAEDSAHKEYAEYTDIYAVFEPTQAKSAIGNRGTFDAFDPDIRRARGATAANPAPAAPAPVTPNPTSPWRDETGRLQFAPGQWLYEKIGKAAGPLLTKLQMKAASPELKRMLREMKLQVAKAQETAGAVATEAMKLTEDERAMVSDIVEQELAAGTIPPAHALRLAAMINSTMGAQTDELVRLGMLTADSADMWRGKYLPRYYKNKLGKQVGDAWADAVGKMFGRTRAMAGIKGKHLKGRGLYESVQASEVAEWERLGWEVRDPDYPAGTGAEISQKILSGDLAPEDTVQMWRDYSREEREKMGEIRDAGFRFVMGYMQTQRDIALGRLFEQLADNAEMSSKKETAEFTVRVPDGTVAGTGAKRYGKLSGRWVSKDTFSHLSQIEESQSEAWKMYRKALALWKEGKVALNPVSHVNNMVSNLTMAHFAGVSYLRADKYIAAAKDFATKAAGIQEAKDAGLFLGTMSDAELMNVLPEDLKALVRNQMSAAERFTVDNNKWSAFNVMTFWLRKPMGWAYQAEDTFFRYLIYKEARSRGLEPGDAVDYAQKYIFAYDDLPKGARMVRDFGIPFFAYTYKAVPTLLHTALTHPIRMAAPAAVLWGINAAAYAIAAGDDDDDWLDTLQKYVTDADFRAKVREKEKLEREHLPEWMKGSTSLGTPKAIRLGMDEVTKLPLFIDTSRIVPGGDLFDVNPNGGGIPWIQPLTPSNPLLTTYMAMFGNRDAWFGKEVVDANDTRGEAAAKRAEWLWKQASPAIAFGNYHFERGMNALAQATGQEIRWAPEAVAPNAVVTGMGRDGLPVQPKYAAMQTFGLKVRPIDLETSEAIENSLKQKMIRDIDTEMRRLRRLSGKGAISDSVYEREYEKAQEKKDRLRSGLTVDGDEK